MKISSLYECFERHLNSSPPDGETDELFVARVLEDYITSLLETGYTLGPFAEEVYEDLQEEVIEMLQKKTYGYASVEQFRKSGTKS